MILPRAGAIAAAMLLASIDGSLAGDPTGTWITEGGQAKVRIAACSNALCGTIVALQEPNDRETGRPKTDKNNPDVARRGRPIIGVEIVLGMKPNGTTNKWTGQVYNAEDGRIYTGALTLQDANTLKLEGCILGGIICKAQTWNRAS